MLALRSADDARGLMPPVYEAAKESVDDDVPTNAVIDRLRVFVRVRPPTQREQASYLTAVTAVPSSRSLSVVLRDRTTQHNATFDAVFSGADTQDDVFAQLRPAVRGTVAGISASILSYGQTGTGKTFTMLGSGFEDRAREQAPAETGWSSAQHQTWATPLQPAYVRASKALAQALLEDTKEGHASWGLVPRAVHEVLLALRDRVAAFRAAAAPTAAAQGRRRGGGGDEGLDGMGSEDDGDCGAARVSAAPVPAPVPAPPSAHHRSRASGTGGTAGLLRSSSPPPPPRRLPRQAQRQQQRAVPAC